MTSVAPAPQYGGGGTTGTPPGTPPLGRKSSLPRLSPMASPPLVPMAPPRDKVRGHGPPGGGPDYNDKGVLVPLTLGSPFRLSQVPPGPPGNVETWSPPLLLRREGVKVGRMSNVALRMCVRWVGERGEEDFCLSFDGDNTLGSENT